MSKASPEQNPNVNQGEVAVKSNFDLEAAKKDSKFNDFLEKHPGAQNEIIGVVDDPRTYEETLKKWFEIFQNSELIKDKVKKLFKDKFYIKFRKLSIPIPENAFKAIDAKIDELARDTDATAIFKEFIESFAQRDELSGQIGLMEEEIKKQFGNFQKNKELVKVQGDLLRKEKSLRGSKKPAGGFVNKLLSKFYTPESEEEKKVWEELEGTHGISDREQADDQLAHIEKYEGSEAEIDKKHTELVGVAASIMRKHDAVEEAEKIIQQVIDEEMRKELGVSAGKTEQTAETTVSLLKKIAIKAVEKIIDGARVVEKEKDLKFKEGNQLHDCLKPILVFFDDYQKNPDASLTDAEISDLKNKVNELLNKINEIYTRLGNEVNPIQAPKEVDTLRASVAELVAEAERVIAERQKIPQPKREESKNVTRAIRIAEEFKGGGKEHEVKIKKNGQEVTERVRDISYLDIFEQTPDMGEEKILEILRDKIRTEVRKHFEKFEKEKAVKTNLVEAFKKNIISLIEKKDTSEKTRQEIKEAILKVLQELIRDPNVVSKKMILTTLIDDLNKL